MKRIITVWAGFVSRIAFGILFSFPLTMPGSAQTVAQLLDPTAQRSDLRAVLAAWGDPAVVPIVAAIQAERSASPVRLGVLLHAIRDIATPAGEIALRALLADTRPYVRGTAAKLLAERGAKCSIPALAALLSDSAEFAKTPQGQTLQMLTVGDVVAGALKRLTAQQPTGSTNEIRAAYQEWWTANQSSLGCGGGQ